MKVLSLKFFFNRKGMVVRLMLGLGWLATLGHLIGLTAQWPVRGGLTSFLFLGVTFLAGMITRHGLTAYYRPEDRGYGIEDHFQKNLVPLAYLLVVTHFLYFFWYQAWPWLLLVFVFLSAMQAVNFTMLYFHRHDGDQTPPSYFSRNTFH